MTKDDTNRKAILISGGAGGVGLATARRFAASGARVMLADLAEDRLAAAAQELSELGPVGTIVTDVRRPEECEQAIAETVRAFGQLDVLVNAAGVWLEGDSAQTTEDEWDRVMDINLKGVFFMCTKAIPELKKNQGCIINISSDAGVLGDVGAAVYCASKGGVNLLTRALALELAPDLVRVNAVCPSDIMSPMLEGQASVYGDNDPEGYLKSLLKRYPQGKNARFIRPEEVAGFIFYLASEEARPITGAILSMDFGSTTGL